MRFYNDDEAKENNLSMNKTQILIRGFHDPNNLPNPEQIASIVEAVLKVPGVRVQSVEVTTIGESTTVVRRIKNIAAAKKPKRASAASMETSASVEPNKINPELASWENIKPHVFQAIATNTDICRICGRGISHPVH